MIGWMEILVAQLRYEELLHEAEEYRMLQHGSPHRTSLAPYWRAVFWLGKILITLGTALKGVSISKLQKITVPTPRPTDLPRKAF